jgi:hypothetical protein
MFGVSNDLKILRAVIPRDVVLMVNVHPTNRVEAELCDGKKPMHPNSVTGIPVPSNPTFVSSLVGKRRW